MRSAVRASGSPRDTAAPGAGVAEALAAGREVLSACGIEGAAFESGLLLAHALGIDRGRLAAVDRGPLPVEALARYEAMVRRRASREPSAHILGVREFWSHPFAVDARVLVPRPETELLVEATLARVPGKCRIADLCTGSGNVALSLAGELLRGSFWGTDVSPDALEVAAENANRLGLADRVQFLRGDLFEPLAGFEGALDAVVANPPYVPSGQIGLLAPEVRDHEPRLALDGGPDGLAVLRRLVDGAPRFLRPGGWLLVEVGHDQAGDVLAHARSGGRWREGTALPDLAGIPRVVALELT